MWGSSRTSLPPRKVPAAITIPAATRMMSLSTYWPSSVGAPCGPANSRLGSITSGERMPTNCAASTQMATRMRAPDPIRKQMPMKHSIVATT